MEADGRFGRQLCSPLYHQCKLMEGLGTRHTSDPLGVKIESHETETQKWETGLGSSEECRLLDS
jgi:hypothetical protein